MNKKCILFVAIITLLLLSFIMTSCNKAGNSELAKFVKENHREVEKVTKKIMNKRSIYPLKIKCYSTSNLPEEEYEYLQNDIFIDMRSLVATCLVIEQNIEFGTIYEFSTEEDAKIALEQFNTYEYTKSYFRIKNWIYYDYFISYILLENYIIIDDYLLSKDLTVCLRYMGTSKEVELPETVKKIIEFSFNDTMVEKIICNNELREISISAFSYNEKIKTIILNEGLEKISAFAFNNCSNLEIIHFPYTLKHIGNGAFIECKALKEVNIPKSIEYIGQLVFAQCENLEEIVIHFNQNTEWGRFVVFQSYKVKIKVIGEEPPIKPWKYNTFYLEKYDTPCEIEYIVSDSME